MTTGQKIKLARIFRGLTMKELGIAAGLPQSTADSRMGQYESDIRIPKTDFITKIAEVLNVSPCALMQTSEIPAIKIMQQLFWLEEEINLLTNRQESKRTRFVHSHLLHSGVTNIQHLIPEYHKEWQNQSCTLSDVLTYALDEYKDMQEHFLNNRISIGTYIEWKFQWPINANLWDFLVEKEPHVFKKITNEVYEYKLAINSDETKTVFENNYMNLYKYFFPNNP